MSLHTLAYLNSRSYWNRAECWCCASGKRITGCSAEVKGKHRKAWAALWHRAALVSWHHACQKSESSSLYVTSWRPTLCPCFCPQQKPAASSRACRSPAVSVLCTQPGTPWFCFTLNKFGKVSASLPCHFWLLECWRYLHGRQNTAHQQDLKYSRFIIKRKKTHKKYTDAHMTKVKCQYLNGYVFWLLCCQTSFYLIFLGLQYVWVSCHQELMLICKQKQTIC